MMETFPEWSDDDSSELDDFLSKPWPDENVRTNSAGWPEFHEPKWRHFSSSNLTSKIVSISAIPSDEQEDDCRDELNNARNDWSDTRDFDDDDDESVLTLSSLAGSTLELAQMARPTTPTKTQPQPQSQRLLRQKLPMLLCKSERIKQPSPGDKRVHFAEQHSNENVLPLDPVIEIGVDSKTEKLKIKHPVMVKPPVVFKPPRTQQQVRPYSRPEQPASSFSRPEQRGRSSSRPDHQGRPSSRSDHQGRPSSRPEQQGRSSSRPKQQAVPRMTTNKNKDLRFQEDSGRLEAYSGKCSPSNWIHNANLFEDKTLPSNTLDFFCRDSSLAAPPVREVSYSEEDTVTTSSQSTGSGISSLPSGAVDEKLAQVFSLSSIHEEAARDPPPPPPPPRFAARDPPARLHAPRISVQVQDYGVHAAPSDSYETENTLSPHNLHDYHVEPSIDTTSPYNQRSQAIFSHAPPSGTKVADRQKWLNAAFKRDRPDLDGRPGAVPVTKVHGAVEKFGGKASRVNAVKQKKEELERKLAEKSKGPPTFKTKWEGRPGSYKKKVVLTSYH